MTYNKNDRYKSVIFLVLTVPLIASGFIAANTEGTIKTTISIIISAIIGYISSFIIIICIAFFLGLKIKNNGEIRHEGKYIPEYLEKWIYYIIGALGFIITAGIESLSIFDSIINDLYQNINPNTINQITLLAQIIILIYAIGIFIFIYYISKSRKINN